MSLSRQAESGLPGQSTQGMEVVVMASGPALLSTSPSFIRLHFPHSVLSRDSVARRQKVQSACTGGQSEGKVSRSPLFPHALVGLQKSRQNADWLLRIRANRRSSLGRQCPGPCPADTPACHSEAAPTPEPPPAIN